MTKLTDLWYAAVVVAAAVPGLGDICTPRGDVCSKDTPLLIILGDWSPVVVTVVALDIVLRDVRDGGRSPPIVDSEAREPEAFIPKSCNHRVD